jgi:hypothetical protein
MEAIRSSETSVLIRATRRHLPEDDNHHSHRRGNLKSYILFSLMFVYINPENLCFQTSLLIRSNFFKILNFVSVIKPRIISTKQVLY